MTMNCINLIHTTILLIVLTACRCRDVECFLVPTSTTSFSNKVGQYYGHHLKPSSTSTSTSLASSTSPSTSPSTPPSTPSSTATEAICTYHEVKIPTSQPGPPKQAISVEDLTPTINSLLHESGMINGSVNIISRHTTTALTINERESRLAQDMQEYFLSLAPPDERSTAKTAKGGVKYYHNDIDKRPDSEEEKQRCIENGWDIENQEELQAWRDQEPINAHSHLLSMLLGSSETIPVVDGKMVIGQWQSILLVDLDGPRDRTVGIQFHGYR